MWSKLKERRVASVFITGSTDGLGRAAAQLLLSGGHQVVLHARSEARAEGLADLASQAAGVVVGDLRRAAELHGLAEQVNAIGRMDAVIHNAGVYVERSRGSTPEGYPVTLAVNTIAPYVLTALIKRPDRLIYLSSGLHRGGEGSLEDIDWTRRPWDAGRAYAESKLFVVALAFALTRRWPNVLCHAVDPGWVRTKMGGPGAPVDLETGARTQAWLAVSDEPAAKFSGRYWRNRQEEPPAKQATEPAFQDKLITVLRDMTGVNLPQT
jgi:NAD(P)-dependent dehydrogenase (short-subunit alcohol dehydrogenase family)